MSMDGSAHSLHTSTPTTSTLRNTIILSSLSDILKISTKCFTFRTREAENLVNVLLTKPTKRKMSAPCAAHSEHSSGPKVHSLRNTIPLASIFDILKIYTKVWLFGKAETENPPHLPLTKPMKIRKRRNVDIKFCILLSRDFCLLL